MDTYEERYIDEPVDDRPSFERYLAIGEAASLVEQEHTWADDTDYIADEHDWSVRDLAVGWFTDAADRFAGLAEQADEAMEPGSWDFPEPQPPVVIDGRWVA